MKSTGFIETEVHHMYGLKYFKLHEVETLPGKKGEPVVVEFRSKKASQKAPISLSCQPEDLIKLGKALESEGLRRLAAVKG